MTEARASTLGYGDRSQPAIRVERFAERRSGQFSAMTCAVGAASVHRHGAVSVHRHGAVLLVKGR
jgi:hypothetical protein